MKVLGERTVMAADHYGEDLEIATQNRIQKHKFLRNELTLLWLNFILERRHSNQAAVLSDVRL